MLLLIDNYDSFTWNLVHYLAEAGAEVRVVRNDAMSAADVLAQGPDGVVLSPGPCAPAQAGICLDMVHACAGAGVPLLGVCLGHQAIGEAFGGEVVRAERIVHGKLDRMLHDGTGVFAGLPAAFDATRYHSLVVRRETLPDALAVNAELACGTIMGLRHRDLPIHGVQFHPESIASEHGRALLSNFLAMLPGHGADAVAA